MTITDCFNTMNIYNKIIFVILIKNKNKNAMINVISMAKLIFSIPHEKIRVELIQKLVF